MIKTTWEDKNAHWSNIIFYDGRNKLKILRSTTRHYVPVWPPFGDWYVNTANNYICHFVTYRNSRYWNNWKTSHGKCIWKDGLEDPGWKDHLLGIFGVYCSVDNYVVTLWILSLSWCDDWCMLSMICDEFTIFVKLLSLCYAVHTVYSILCGYMVKTVQQTTTRWQCVYIYIRVTSG